MYGVPHFAFKMIRNWLLTFRSRNDFSWPDRKSSSRLTSESFSSFFAYFWEYCKFDCIYLVNKLLPAASISEDNACGWETNKHLNETQAFQDKCEIMRTLSHPRALYSDITTSQKGVYYPAFLSGRDGYSSGLGFSFVVESPSGPGCSNVR